jgi:hypothetical protein
MRLHLFIIAIVLSVSMLPAQEKEKEKTDNFEAVIIPVKTLSGDSFNRLAKMLSVFGARYTADDRLRTIVVYAPKNVVEQMRTVVAQLDQPGSEAAIGRNIEMTMSFLRCYTNSPANAPAALPAELEAVAKQIRAATQYKVVQLWDILPLHLQEGKDAEHSYRLPGPIIQDIPGAIATAHLQVRPEAVTRKADGRYVRFDRVSIRFRIPFRTGQPGGEPKSLIATQFSFSDFSLNTAGDFKEGQKTVLGKVSGVDDESAIFVVIALKILD